MSEMKGRTEMVARVDFLQVSPRRIKSIREALNMTQAKFGSIFGDDKQKMVSHWEKGDAPPPIDRLQDLLKFLRDPRPWMIEKKREVHPHVAILRFGWEDPDEHEFSRITLTPQAFRDGMPRIIEEWDPRTSEYKKVPLGLESMLWSEPEVRKKSFDAGDPDTRFGLDALVSGVIDPTFTDAGWEALLERCSYPRSKNPFERIKVLEYLERVGSDAISPATYSDEFFQLAAEDERRHGGEVLEELARPRGQKSIIRDLLRTETEQQAKGFLRGPLLYLMTSNAEDRAKEVSQRSRFFSLSPTEGDGDEESDDGLVRTFQQRLSPSEGLLVGIEVLLRASRLGPNSFDGELLEKAFGIVTTWKAKMDAFEMADQEDSTSRSFKVLLDEVSKK